MKIPILFAFFIIPFWALLFVFGAVFGSIWVETVTGQMPLAALWTVVWWGGMLAGTAYVLKGTEFV